MIHRMDPPADPERVAPPTGLRPMLASLATSLPTGEGWAFEMKWDGVRALALVQGGRVRLTSRNGNDVSAAYPEVRGLGEQLGATEVLLDGEVVAVGDDGRPSFQRLQQRMHVREPSAVRRLAEQVPVVYMVFDILGLDGRLTTSWPYRRRRDALDALALRGPAWQTPPAGFDDGVQAFETSLRLGFEGVVAKRVDSPYEPGRRSRAWLKVKHQLRQEFVVGGWLPGQGARTGRIGALLVGYHDPDGRLRFAGRVGTGFTDAELDRLGALLLAPDRLDASPFADRGLPKEARFVAPRYVADVRFTEWTDNGRIRHPAYLGVRDDKDPAEVVREVPAAPTPP
jgi:bifunctional non-homologous end joining protein LigD